MDEVYVIPIVEYTNLIGVDESISGLEFDNQGWFPYLTDIAWAGP